MFFVFEYFLLVFCILKPCSARFSISDLKSCKEEENVSKICLTNKNGYFKPFPVVVDSEMTLRNLIEIDENRNSITAQFELLTNWLDTGIAVSNVKSM